MKKYINCAILPIPIEKLEEYKKLATTIGQVWKDCGALEYMECSGDDIQPGKITSFPQSVNLKEGEIVVFAFTTFKDREHQDQAKQKFMADPRIQNMDYNAMPFDRKRMIWGSFKTIVEL